MSNWLLVGDNTGLFDEQTISDIIVYLEGKDPCKIVSGDLWMWDRKTYFIIYGEAIIHEKSFEIYGDPLIDRRYTITCNKWDILTKIDSRDNFRMNFSNKYLTIYDFKWYDDIRKKLGIFNDAVDY